MHRHYVHQCIGHCLIPLNPWFNIIFVIKKWMDGVQHLCGLFRAFRLVWPPELCRQLPAPDTTEEREGKTERAECWGGQVPAAPVLQPSCQNSRRQQLHSSFCHMSCPTYNCSYNPTCVITLCINLFRHFYLFFTDDIPGLNKC